MDQVEQQVRQILIDNYSLDANTMQASQSLSGDLGLDSLEMVEFAVTLEDTFGVEIPDDAVTAAMTVGDVVAAIKKLKQ
jgi:acyl carrier protein